MEQLALEFPKPPTISKPLTPKGYKGLAGFHKYWGKKPIEAWSFLIENLTNEGEKILDPFLGSGLIAKECVDCNRRFIGFDINPFSIELTKLYLDLPAFADLKKVIKTIKTSVKPKIDSLYKISTGEVVTHFLWEKSEISGVWKKEGGKLTEINLTNKEKCKLADYANKYSKFHVELNLFNNSRINAKADITVSDLFSARALSSIGYLMDSFQHYPHNIRRALCLILTASLGQMSNMVFALTRRGKTKQKEKEKISVGSWVIGYWRPEQHFEVNAWNCFENKANKLLNAIKHTNGTKVENIANSFEEFKESPHFPYLKIGDSEKLLGDIPNNSIKLILTDPPHGDRIPYLELSEMWNAFLGFKADFSSELVVSNAKGRDKGIDQYNKKLSSIFSECARVLERNGLLAVIFNARSSDHWDSLYALEESAGLEYIGCYPMAYSAGSVVQDNRKGSLKSDYVLLYGKCITSLFRMKLSNLFSVVDGWNIDYPKNGSKK